MRSVEICMLNVMQGLYLVCPQRMTTKQSNSMAYESYRRTAILSDFSTQNYKLHVAAATMHALYLSGTGQCV